MERHTPPTLYNNHYTIHRWMAQNEDSPMELIWDDSAQYIEDRNRRSTGPKYFGREARSRWAGNLPCPTFVYGIHASLNSPTPRFTGFGVVENFPGDNPGPNTRYQGSHPINRRASSGTSNSDDSRRFGDTPGQEDELRHRAMASRDRDRFADEPYLDNAQRMRDSNRRHPYNNYDGNRNRGSHAANAEYANNRGNRAPPPPPTLRQARTGLPDPTRTIDNPDLALAPRGPDGHPQSEWAIRQANTTTVEHDDCPNPNPNYANVEEERIARVREKPLAAGNISQPDWREGNPRLLGRFYRLQIHTLEQAYNLVSFLDVGQQEAFEWFTLIVGNLAAFPRNFRTEGEAYLMRYQQDIDKAWWVTTTGITRPPRHERHPNLYKSPRAMAGGSRNAAGSSSGSSYEYSGGAPSSESSNASERPPNPLTRNYGPRANAEGQPQTGNSAPERAREYGPMYAFGTTAHVRPAPSTMDVVTHDTTPISLDDGRGYLGSSPPNPIDKRPANAGEPDSGLTVNSCWTAGDIVRRYMRTHPSMWARGVRGALGRLATSMGESPNVHDVLAHHTGLALSPNERRTNAHQHRVFSLATTGLFSVEGLYAHILRLGEYPLATLPLEHYPYLTDNCTIFIVAAWYAQHGIIPGSQDVVALETYSRVRRNASAGITDLSNANWEGEPVSATALQLTAEQIPHWTTIQNAPLRPFASSGGIEASAHAVPMDGVEHGATAQAGPVLNDVPKDPTSTSSE
ncbi:hypothetical protein C8F04DRAFT_1232469 [Mycena alexandri]|uniref:Uncharacterized protein n=1 Tax=Mycena alexandri TaxID=1745969 RepID=A0AAD6T1V6_9AGAR|nr:hypothetical protein C8F04DRAFT_1232469 [Mycena alexandri]